MEEEIRKFYRVEIPQHCTVEMLIPLLQMFMNFWSGPFPEDEEFVRILKRSELYKNWLIEIKTGK